MKKRRKTITKSIVFFLGILFTVSLFPQIAEADYVTDTLTVKVGYSGMDLYEYVEVGTYHWSDLYGSLPIYEVPYSYFQDKAFNKYNAIVDSGRGFYVLDLLNYLGIYYDDIYNLQFYVNDHQGIQASFDKGALFQERYYFNDLPGHRVVYLDENTWGITGFDFSDAWTDCYPVEPMLAIEDNWASFSEEFEHIGPDFSLANPSCRFRLLFGQTEPTEQLTNLSAKFVSCVYITLAGAPVYGEMGELDGKLGSHTVEMTVSVNNIDIRNALSELMTLTSSDENVLVIRGVTVTPDDVYGDLATVTIDYDIVGQGQASISAGIGSTGSYMTSSETVTAEEPAEEPPGDTSPEDEKSPGGKQAENKADSRRPDPGSGSANPAGSRSTTAQRTGEQAALTGANVLDPAAGLSAAGSTTGVFSLSREAMERIEGQKSSRPQIAAIEDITQVRAEDRSEEKKEAERRRLLWTGLGCAVIAAAGTFSQEAVFKRRLKYSRKRKTIRGKQKYAVS